MRRKCLFLFLCFTILVFAFWLGVWTSWTEVRAHYTPQYAKADITSVLKKEILTEADYNLLFQQTGMTKTGVDELFAEERENELLYLQERFFDEVEVVCLRSNIVVQSERLVAESAGFNAQAGDTRSNVSVAENAISNASAAEAVATSHVENSCSFLPTLQTGDILISFSGHVFGWRYGHAAIVVDAERGLTVEAINLGSDSKLRSVEHWREYPCFAVVRATGIPRERREDVAEYARNNLVGIPYSLFSFVWKADATLPETHCAHLVWCAYEHFGYNLDSDGGLIVTPRDIYDSDLLEVVQVYGLNPEDCTK